MNLKRFLTTSLIVMSSTLCITEAAHAGLLSKRAQKQVALPNHNIQLVTIASNTTSAKLPAPEFKAEKKQPIIMVAHNKQLPQPELQKSAKRHHHHTTKNHVVSAKIKKPAKKLAKLKPKYKPAPPIRVAPFRGISANGNILVMVEPGRNQEVKIMNKTYPGHELVEPTVIKDVLVLRDVSHKNLKKNAPPTIKVKVTTPRLTSIQLRGDSRLLAKNLRTRLLDIDAATRGFINLKGNIGLHHLLQRGTGPINVEWANSDHMKIISRSRGPIRIAGTTDHLTIRANDHADVDTKHLRAHTAIVQTFDKATVAVTVVDALSGFASDLSNIFYYKTPRHLTRHTYDLGNVMQLRYWN